MTATMAARAHDDRPLLSLVVPVYNESEVLGTFYERATGTLGALADLDYELIFVDDGSRDDSYRQLTELGESEEAEQQTEQHRHTAGVVGRRRGHEGS